MARKSGFVRRNNIMRRETLWIGLSSQSLTLASTGAVNLANSLSAGGLALRPFTVVRVRGSFHLRSDQTGASENYGVAFGQAVVTDQATAVGVTAVPTPNTDLESDSWFVYEQVSSRFEFISGVGVESSNGMIVNYDSKAMRKVEDGFDLVQVFECTTTSAAVRNYFRMLVKLH